MYGTARNEGGGSIIELKAHINHFEDGNGPWHGSEISRSCRSSPPFMLRSITTSTSPATNRTPFGFRF